MGAERASARPVRVLRALLAEIRRARRSPAMVTYLLLVLLVAGFYGVHRYSTVKDQEADRKDPVVTDTFGEDEEEEAAPEVPAGERGATGYLVLAAALRAGVFLAAVVLLLHAATMIAGERSGGTLRLLLTRPVSRTDLLLAKAAFLLLTALILVGMAAGVGFLLGLVNGGYGGYFDVRYGMELHPAGDLNHAAWMTLLLAPLGLFAVAAFGLFLSSLFEGSAAAVIAATLAGIGIVVAGFLLPEDSSRLLFTEHVDRCSRAFVELAKGLSGAEFSSRFLLPGLLVPVGTALVFLIGARIMFCRRDIHS